MTSRLTMLLVAALVAACGPKPEPAGTAAKAPAAASAPAAKAPLLLSPEDLRTVTAGTVASGPVVSGSLQPERRADLRAEVAAVVLQVLKDNGEAVRPGDLLVRLDDTALRDSLASAEEAERAATQALEQGERTLQRLRTLQAQGMTSMQALEDAEVRRNAAQSEVAAARTRTVTARQALRRTEVRAPFAGLVSERKVSAGDTVQVGRELLKVIDPASLRFEGLVSADRLGELKTGQRVNFRVNGVPGAEFAGTVRRIDAAANATTRQAAVTISFDDAAKAPRVAGLFAEGRIETGSRQMLTVPEGSVVRSGDATHVWRVQGTALQKVAVKLGERDERRGDYPVLGGLAEGDRILRSPGSNVADGQAVEFAQPVATASAPVAPAASSAK
jgi:membrane fusion protein, multidrug efflux system